MPEPRIAIAYDCLPPVDRGGGERVYRALAEIFAERGLRVDYVTRTGRESADAPFRVVGVWQGEIADARGARTPRAALGFAWAILRHFARHRGDHDLVIVAALPVLNVFAVRLALLGTRTVIATDWLEVWPWRTWRRYSGIVVGTIAYLLQWAGAQVGRIQTVNSRFTRARLLGHRRDADPVVLGLLDLVDAPTPSAQPTEPAQPPTILFVGRHIPDKRLDALPPALAIARQRVPELHAVVVGEGPETAAARRSADMAGVSGVVRFLGRVDDAQLDGLFGSAAALVNPSMREGFGLVVAEAAAHGTPSVVVAGEDNAAAELVVDDENGIVATSVDPRVLGEAIARAVGAGRPLRASTAAWYARERTRRSLHGSADELIARWRDATRARRPRRTRP